MITILPDMDALVLDAIRDGMPDVTARVAWPENWDAHLPMIVARRVAGTAADPRGIDRALVDVQSIAHTRRDASANARTVRLVLLSACLKQFQGTDGYLTRFEDVSGPVELRTGEPTPGPDLFRFQGTYRLTARPFRP